MSKTVTVKLGDRSYDILIGSALPVGGSVADLEGRRALLVSDANVDPLYGARCGRLLEERGVRVTRVVVPAGEKSKSLEEAARLYGAAVAAGLDRKSLVVALGGGVVGDLAGFMAATFLRGVRYLQVPTTLLAMVDSAVGGKTAVNLPQGKNLVGVFHQPVEVVADLDTLRTLPDREYRSGLAEVVKYGVIRDAELFAVCEREAVKLAARDTGLLVELVARCCEIKAEVVACDEREGGVRAILNFGHTLGHAVERVAGYGEWLHGEAVSYGMVYAGRLSVAARGFPADACRRLERLLAALGLPVAANAMGAAPPWPALRAAMTSDKKTEGGLPRFVLAERLGGVAFGCEVGEAVLERVYAGGV